jgi:transposase
MSQTIAAPIPAAVDYERTLVLAIEVSNKSWVLAAQVPGLPHTKAKRTINPEAEALLAAITGYRTRAASGRSIERVIAVYEAGWSGFWLARWLMRRGVEVYVVQPSSVPVDRRMRRAKSDGIDAELLLRTLLAWLRGEPRVCSMVPVPDEADEDARRCVRERTELSASSQFDPERTSASHSRHRAELFRPDREERAVTSPPARVVLAAAASA